MPIMLNLENRKVTIFGGGKIALKKTFKLLEYGASLKIVSKEFHKEFENIKGDLNLISDVIEKDNTSFEKYFENSSLIIAATDSKEINDNIERIAKKRELMFNRVDSGIDSDFFIPGIVRKEGVEIGISTGGRDPHLTKVITNNIEVFLEKLLYELGE